MKKIFIFAIALLSLVSCGTASQFTSTGFGESSDVAMSRAKGHLDATAVASEQREYNVSESIHQTTIDKDGKAVQITEMTRTANTESTFVDNKFKDVQTLNKRKKLTYTRFWGKAKDEE